MPLMRDILGPKYYDSSQTDYCSDICIVLKDSHKSQSKSYNTRYFKEAQKNQTCLLRKERNSWFTCSGNCSWTKWVPSGKCMVSKSGTKSFTFPLLMYSSRPGNLSAKSLSPTIHRAGTLTIGSAMLKSSSTDLQNYKIKSNCNQPKSTIVRKIWR